jgi:hypothetical protein
MASPVQALVIGYYIRYYCHDDGGVISGLCCPNYFILIRLNFQIFGKRNSGSGLLSEMGAVYLIYILPAAQMLFQRIQIFGILPRLERQRAPGRPTPRTVRLIVFGVHWRRN